MIIKKFVGKTEEDAVTEAKKELGNGIVIMNVKQVKPKGLFGFLRSKQTEVTVALEEERENLQRVTKAATEILSSQEKGENKEHTISLSQTAGSNIEKKLDSLQTLLENQIKGEQEKEARREKEKEAEMTEKNTVIFRSDSDTTANEKEEKPDSEQEKLVKLLYNTMIENEVDEHYANQLLEDLEKNQNPNMPFDYLLANIYQKMILKFGKSEGILPAQEGAKLVVFIGPTGVGKTTTIAKLAGKYSVEDKKKIALLTADTYRIAAAEQLRTYADILEVPFRVIYTVEEFQKAIEDFKSYDYIFVDTAGHSHQNEEQLSDMQKLIQAIGDSVPYQSFLVLSATTKYRDLMKIAEKYKEITEFQLIFTKLDETATLGNLYNLKLLTDTSIAYVTYGQNVPDDIETFDAQKTVKQLLGGKC